MLSGYISAVTDRRYLRSVSLPLHVERGSILFSYLPGLENPSRWVSVTVILSGRGIPFQTFQISPLQMHERTINNNTEYYYWIWENLGSHNISERSVCLFCSGLTGVNLWGSFIVIFTTRSSLHTVSFRSCLCFPILLKDTWACKPQGPGIEPKIFLCWERQTPLIMSARKMSRLVIFQLLASSWDVAVCLYDPLSVSFTRVLLFLADNIIQSPPSLAFQNSH